MWVAVAATSITGWLPAVRFISVIELPANAWVGCCGMRGRGDPACEGFFEICDNGVDDDGDTFVDCDDFDCNYDPACP